VAARVHKNSSEWRSHLASWSTYYEEGVK